MFRYGLSTLLAIMTLAAIVAAAFGVNVLLGICAYIACLSLFMLTWRIRVDCQRADSDQPQTQGKSLAARIVFVNLLIGLSAAVAFCVGCTITQVSAGPPLLVPEHRRAEALASFHRALFLSMPIGTAAAFVVYWLSWPTSDE